MANKLLTGAQVLEAQKLLGRYYYMESTVSDLHGKDPAIRLTLGTQCHNHDEPLMGAVKGAIIAEYRQRMAAIRTQLIEWGIDPDLQDDPVPERDY